MATFRFTLLLPLGFLPLLAGAAQAQSASEREALGAFRDSLLAIRDSGTVRRMEKEAGQRSNSHPRDRTLALRHGVALLRLAEYDGRLFDRARGIFADLEQEAPGQFVTSFGIGLAESGKGDWLANEPANLGTRVGHGAYRSAVKAFLATLQREPDFSPALSQLSRLNLLLRDTTVTHDVLAAYQRARNAGLADPDFLLTLGTLERAIGSLDSAATIFQELNRASPLTATATLELLRTRLVIDSTTDMALYDSVAVSGDSAVVAGLRADLASIASESELAAFDSAQEGAGRALLLHRFWLMRDASDLRTPGERLREHYRRLLYVRRHFLLGNNRRYYSHSDLYRSPSNELDDRGVVYMRQGAPDLRLVPLLYGLNPNETWVYHRPDRDLVLHFSSGGQDTEGGDLSDFRLVGSVMDLRGHDVPFDMRLLSRVSVSDTYTKMLSWGPYGAARAAAAERRLGEESTREAVSTDHHPLHFRHPLDAHADVVAVGSLDGNPLVHLAFAFRPLSSLAAGTLVAARLRIALIRSDGAVIRWIDTLTFARVGTIGNALGLLSFGAPPGDYGYRIAIMASDSAGAVLPMGNVRVSGTTGSELALSSLALGRREMSAEWEREPGDTVLLATEKAFRTGDNVELFWELYGLSADRSYQTIISLYERHGERRGHRRLTLSFDGRSRKVVVADHKVIRLEGVNAGEYWLEVTVMDESGRKTMSEQPILVEGRADTSPAGN